MNLTIKRVNKEHQVSHVLKNLVDNDNSKKKIINFKLTVEFKETRADKLNGRQFF